MFTGDAFNGLINCYKELLDLVERKKKKNRCQKSLHNEPLALMVVSMSEGENEPGLPLGAPGVSREGAAGSLMGSSGEAVPVLPALSQLPEMPAHPQLPFPANKPVLRAAPETPLRL